LAALVVLLYMTAIWVASLILRNSSIVDIFWGLGFVLLNGVAFALAPQGFLARKALLTVLVTLWGLRVASQLAERAGTPLDLPGMGGDGRGVPGRAGGGGRDRAAITPAPILSPFQVHRAQHTGRGPCPALRRRH